MDLFKLFSAGTVEEVNEYLHQHPSFDINKDLSLGVNRRGGGPLHVACNGGNLEVVKFLLDNPLIDVNKTNNMGRTPFFYACMNGHDGILEILLKDSRVDINMADCIECTPLWQASYYGRLGVIKLMIASGREIDNLDIKVDWDDNEYTAIEIAKKMNQTEVVSLLERFIENQAHTRHEVRVELGLVDKDAAEVFATVVFLCDGLLSLKVTPENEKEERAQQFFAITMKVPLELQMNISGKAASSSKEYIRHDMSEPAFKHLAKVYKN